MAFHTFADPIAQAAYTYPVLGNDAARVLAYLKRIVRDVAVRMQVEQTEESLSSLVAGTREYTKDSTTTPMDRVMEAWYYTAANTATKLEPVSVDWLDQYRPTWRTTADQGTPNVYYVRPKSDGTVVWGLDPIPDTTTDAGYPKAVFYGTDYRVVTTATDVPGIFPDIGLFSNGLKKLYAEDEDVAMYPAWESLYEHYVDKTISYINDLQQQNEGTQRRMEWLTNPSIA